MSNLEALRAFTREQADALTEARSLVRSLKQDLTYAEHTLSTIIGGSGVPEECALNNIHLAADYLDDGAGHLTVAVEQARAAARSL